MPKFSDDLELKLAQYRAEYRLIVNGWLESGTFGITYPALLVETFHYVKHSCSLMNYASAQLGHERLALQAYFARHIAEEVGHEEWLLNDLEELGYSRQSVESSAPLAETINLIGSQFYVINYLHPAGLLGYVYVMESTPPNEVCLAYLEAYGIGSDARSFLSKHGQEDQKHSSELRHMLDTHFREPVMREAATWGAIMGLSNINKLCARIRSGNYLNCFPEIFPQTMTSAARPLQTRLPSFTDALPPNPFRDGGNHPSNQNRERRNKDVTKEKKQRATSADRRKHVANARF